jgi:hypothetical protein
MLSKDNVIIVGDLSLEPSSYTSERSERAMPGTAAIKQVLTLIQPPAPPENPVPEDDRDYGPDPVAEYVLRFDAPSTFSCSEMSEALRTIKWPTPLERPCYYVVTPSGQTTYLMSIDAPTEGVAIVAGWSLRDLDPAEFIAASAEKLARWLSKRRFGFKAASEISLADIETQVDRAAEIQVVAPERVECLVYLDKTEDMLDGKRVWNLLHSMGFKWGDMDCFQWADETGQSDYLIWVEVYDNQYGYAIPEYIADGRQNFAAVSFSFNPSRTPSPLHVLGEMLKAVAFFQKETGSRVAARIDGEVVDGAEQLVEAVQTLVDGLAALGVDPGSSSVCRLR